MITMLDEWHTRDKRGLVLPKNTLVSILYFRRPNSFYLGRIGKFFGVPSGPKRLGPYRRFRVIQKRTCLEPILRPKGIGWHLRKSGSRSIAIGPA